MIFDKDINDLKIGIAISTYSQENTHQHRYNIISKSLESLKIYLGKTKLNLYILIVVDGDIPQKHLNILKKYENIFDIYFRKKNGGVARTKNTSIRILLEKNSDIGFLMDDDVLYKGNCFEKYCEVMLKARLHHICYVQIPEVVHPKSEWKNMGIIKKKT